MPKSRYQLLVGLHVTNDEQYTQYRQHIMPLPESNGGNFEYDFTIDATLKNAAGHPINRLFVLSFPDQKAQHNFFNSPTYLQIRETYFQPSVNAASIISTWEQPQSQ